MDGVVVRLEVDEAALGDLNGDVGEVIGADDCVAEILLHLRVMEQRAHLLHVLCDEGLEAVVEGGRHLGHVVEGDEDGLRNLVAGLRHVVEIVHLPVEPASDLGQPSNEHRLATAGL